jgi:cytochrome c-type biogenesis protein CcmF
VSIAELGNLILCAVLVCASSSLSLALAAASGRPQLLPAVRHALYATCSLVALGFFLLCYAFQIHDFSILYVAHYSDRSMSWPYLMAAAWSGQDGSLLAWTFVLALCAAACARGVQGRLQQLQAPILGALGSVIIFFAVLMLFAANPFAVSMGDAPVDGNGLNPLLRNFWMLIHPPVLYLGMVAWAAPYAIGMAALVRGRLADEWVTAARPWAVFAWVALFAGNLLGMVWSYEELGWGGYWAWDPVENASLLPMLSGTAYLHSVLQQRQRGMFKLWNLFLLCLTFFLTVFSTFLTRSGLVASVHAFSASGMSPFFAVYLCLIAASCSGLIAWRARLLGAENRIETLLSRDFAFALLNWLMMAMLGFVALASLFPLFSEAVSGQTVTVGPGFYNRWMVPLGLLLLLLLGAGPLLAFRRTDRRALGRALGFPAAAALAALALHAMAGPDAAPAPSIGESASGAMPGPLLALFPRLASALCAFVAAAHLQRLWRDTAASMRAGGRNAARALGRVLSRAPRRYGAYTVHLGMALMCFGFSGAAYDRETQAALKPNETASIKGYRVRFDGSRVEERLDRSMLFADLTVLRGSTPLGRVAPARFFYAKPPGSSTSEVSILTTPREDIYVILNGVNEHTGAGSFRVIVRPLVAWIWVGGMFMILGAAICLAPSRRKPQARPLPEAGEREG